MTRLQHDLGVVAAGRGDGRQVRREEPRLLRAPPARADPTDGEFAAVGSAVYYEAKAKGIGREIPTDWFLESVHP